MQVAFEMNEVIVDMCQQKENRFGGLQYIYLYIYIGTYIYLPTAVLESCINFCDFENLKL